MRIVEADAPGAASAALARATRVNACINLRLTAAALACGALALLASLAALPASADSAATNGLIAFEATLNGEPQVLTIAPDGTALKQVTHITSPELWGVAWVPSSSTLAFSASGSGPDLLYQVDSTGGETLAMSPACNDACLGDDFPAYAPSGGMVAFERALGPVQNNNAAAVAIFTMKSDGSDLMQLTQNTRPTSTEDHRPTWSPDGTKIAFQRLNTTAAPKNHASIFVMNADGTKARRLTRVALNANAPQWSPDGTRIIFNSNEPAIPGKDANIYSIRPDGSGLRQLTHYTSGKQQAYAGSWSPDGKRIVFHLRGANPNGPGVNQLFIMNRDGSRIRQLTHLAHGANPVYPAWGVRS